MQDIPKPQVLSPDRIDRDDREDMTAEDHRSQAQLLDKALHETCAYADQLWTTLDGVRSYLLESLPPDPRSPDATTTAASPTGPDDARGWQNWVDTFADTTSVLCGPHGDSGFGLSRAKEEAQLRRVGPAVAAAVARPAQNTNDRPADPPHTRSWTPLKAVGAVVLGILALRGLRPR